MAVCSGKGGCRWRRQSREDNGSRQNQRVRREVEPQEQIDMGKRKDMHREGKQPEAGETLVMSV